MIRCTAFLLALTLLVFAACTTTSPVPVSITSSGTSSSSSSSTGGPVDPCDAIVLPPCDAPCPADYDTQLCGTPCFSKTLHCGDALGKGMTCVDGRWACETREAPGRFAGCDLVCRSLCSAMNAHGEDMCGAFIGYRWNGHACEGVDCSCVGRDCTSLFEDGATCMALHQSCLPGGPDACAGLPCGASCGEGCTDVGCPAFFTSCDAQGQCSDRNPVCMPPPCAEGCLPPPASCEACDFGGVKCPEPMTICVFGTCVPSVIDCDMQPPDP